MDEYPIKLEEMIACTFNFDNLVKIIQFLNRKNNDLAAIVKNITKKLPQIDRLREELDNIQIKTSSLTSKCNEIESSQANYSNKLMDCESKTLHLFTANDELKHKISEIEEKNKLHETNLNNLNRVVEDNTKTAKSQEEKMALMQQNIENCNSKLDQALEEMNSIASSNAKIKESMTEVSMEVFELKDELERKNNDIEKKVNALIASVSEISTGQGTTNTDANQAMNGGRSELSNNKVTAEEIEKIKETMEELSKSNKEMDKLIKASQEASNNQFAKISARLNQLQQAQTNPKGLPTVVKIDDKELLNKQEGYQADTLELNKIIDSIKATNSGLLNKANKEEFDNFNHFVVSKLDILNDKINESYKSLEGRLKAIHTIQANSSSVPAIDLDLISQTIEKHVTEQIETLISNSIDRFQNEGDLAQNPQINSLIDTINKHTDELNEAYKSIVDIRSILVSNEILEDIDDIKSRLEINEEDIRRVQIITTELKKSFDGEDDDFTQQNQGTANNQREGKGNLKSQINALSYSYRELVDKVAILEKRHNEMTTEVKDSIKSSLKYETEKVIEQFQKNLNSFTSKFEHQLKNKIDQIGLTSFEYKLNSKFTNEIKEKLDKNDLKKNNHAINRKLDSLENKISKTLVDTIIDLQMDEAPLIVKKNAKNIEKCVSCNQVLPNQAPLLPYAISNEHSGYLGNSASLNKMRVSKYNIKEKDKLPELTHNNNNNGNHDD